MEFWKIWLIGIAITIMTRVAITIIYEKKKCEYVSEFIEVVLQLLIVICIMVVAGIPISKLLEMFCNLPIPVLILFAIIVCAIVYRATYFILGLYNFKHKLLQALYVFTIIITVIAFVEPSVEYNRNIGEITEKVIEKTEKRELLKFNNISLEEVTNEKYEDILYSNVKGIFQNTPLSNTISYMYVDENNNCILGNALLKNCQMSYISKNETPYVMVYSYYKYTILIDHRTGETTIKEGSEQRWEEYNFCVPRELLYYISELS